MAYIAEKVMGISGWTIVFVILVLTFAVFGVRLLCELAGRCMLSVGEMFADISRDYGVRFHSGLSYICWALAAMLSMYERWAPTLGLQLVLPTKSIPALLVIPFLLVIVAAKDKRKLPLLFGIRFLSLVLMPVNFVVLFPAFLFVNSSNLTSFQEEKRALNEDMPSVVEMSDTLPVPCMDEVAELEPSSAPVNPTPNILH